LIVMYVAQIVQGPVNVRTASITLL
jgi:hypothetical protein